MKKLMLAVVGLCLLAGPVYANKGQVSGVSKKQLKCLALNIYHEARGESIVGQRAVALVTLQRVNSPEFPDDICSVVYQPAAFSWTSHRKSVKNQDAYENALAVAQQALLIKSLGLDVLKAEYFHAVDVEPSWRHAFTFVVQIGNHKFYRR